MQSLAVGSEFTQQVSYQGLDTVWFFIFTQGQSKLLLSYVSTFEVCAHAIYNDKLYIFAGYGWKGCYLNDLYEFDFTTRVWEQLTFPKNQQPPERHSMSHAIYNDKWYMFGGIGPNGQRSNELFAFDFSTFLHSHQSMTIWCLISPPISTETRQWAVIAAPQGQVPGPRWGHTAVVWQNAMYVFGGYSDAFHNDLFKYDFGSFK
jgi:hypothetical protein